MTAKEAKSHILATLSPKFGESEAKSMLRILEEDYTINGKLVLRDGVPMKIIDGCCEKLLNDYPIQYLVGKAYFYNGFFKVNKHVLIPRSDTEVLVYEALRLIRSLGLNSIIDIGTGSGCIPIAIQKEQKSLKAYGVDISREALEISKQNNGAHETAVEFINIDFLDIAKWGELPAVDLVISNPPYINRNESKKMSNSTLKHEPSLALFPKGEDELIFYKYLVDYFIESNSKALLCELNEFKAEDIHKIFNSYFNEVTIISDLQGKNRVLKVIK
jgi:release factor glutamine methyltransferase